MSKGSTILLLGLLVAFLPFTGFSTIIKIILAVLFGFTLMVLGFLVRQERLWLLRAMSGERKTDAYTENNISVVQPEVSQEI